MKQSQIVGRIEPLLKVRIDNIQDQINRLLKNYALSEPYYISMVEVLQALIERKAMLTNRI